MSSTTPNIGMTKTTASETIGQNWAANNETGGNLDILDTKIGPVGNTSVQAQLDALNSKISSTTGGVPKRIAGVCENGASFAVTINADYSMHEGFALVAVNLGGNALGGVALLFLGRGTQKVKDIIGSMSSSYWSASYNGNAWTITNNSGSQMYYTILVTK